MPTTPKGCVSAQAADYGSLEEWVSQVMVLEYEDWVDWA
jgi:hypothetical protein